MGPAARFLDYDGWTAAGYPAVNGMAWTGHWRSAAPCGSIATIATARSPTVTERAGLAVEIYGMGVAVADYNNDGFPDILINRRRQNRLFQNNGRGRFIDVTE